MGLRGAKPATSSPFGRQEKLAQMKARLSREYPEIADPSRDGEVRPPDLRIERGHGLGEHLVVLGSPWVVAVLLREEPGLASGHGREGVITIHIRSIRGREVRHR